MTLPSVVVHPLVVTNSWGEATVALDFENQPVLVVGGAEERVYRQPFTVPLGRVFHFDKIRRFIATERGDLGEWDIELYAGGNGLSVFRNSVHKEMPSNYPAWEIEATSFHASQLRGELVARVTANNVLLSDDEIRDGRDGNRLTARVHFNVILSGKVV